MGHAPLPDSGFLEDWAARLRQAAERPVVGILLRGSHARRAATAHSDVDLDVLVGGAPYAARRAYLDESAGQVTHVSVAARDIRSWVHRLGEPADWAFGLPVTAPRGCSGPTRTGGPGSTCRCSASPPSHPDWKR
ncbi:nucleotidyltransferase domain-containing protein [Micromonospora sp. STR1s_5]|nr:nucleotidyltransferase domain-containing protein [Micromonospora sp. STR1s_5]